jgi:hypothetical protein
LHPHLVVSSSPVLAEQLSAVGLTPHKPTNGQIRLALLQSGFERQNPRSGGAGVQATACVGARPRCETVWLLWNLNHRHLELATQLPR